MASRDERQLESSGHDLPEQRYWRAGLRNGLAALILVGAYLLVRWLKLFAFRFEGEVYWWIWWALAAFVVTVVFFQPFLTAKLGARASGVFLAMIMFLVLAGMLFAVWWSLREKD